MIYQLIDSCNVIVSRSYEYDKLLELKSLRKFISILNEKLKSNFVYYVFWGEISDEQYLLSKTEKIDQSCHNILFWIGDEEGNIPSDKTFQKFDFIFKVHLKDKDAIRTENGINVYRKGLYHFPLLTIDDVPELPVLSFENRKYDLYYCGNLNKNRIPFYLSLKKKPQIKERITNFLLQNNLRGGDRMFNLCFGGKTFDFSDVYKNSYIKFYSGFNNGDNYTTYAHFLQESKIVLSPKGFHSTECFRFYEAMRQGCIVITEELPHVECYKDAPCISVKSWKQLPDILANTDLYTTFNSSMIRKFYDDKLSINGIAQYVYNRILSI